MRWIAIAGLLAVAALAAGCGGGSEGETSGGQTGAAAGDETAPAGKGSDDRDAAIGGSASGGDQGTEAGGEADGRGAKPKKQTGAATKRQAIEGRAGGPATVEVVESQFGEVVADGSGEALYLFDKETEPTSECYGECAVAWPPLLTSGAPKAGPGAEAGLLGTTEREDGQVQVTYDGHPLYYYVDDSPGTILCHNVPEFGGLWLVVQPDGEAVA